jgi:hypothetical protein
MRSQNGTTPQKVGLRRTHILVVVALSGFVTTALSVDPIETILPNGAGHLLETDREGHFLRDIEYVDCIAFKYRKDGSFERLYYRKDADGNKALSSGNIGKYQYDARKLAITCQRTVRTQPAKRTSYWPCILHFFKYLLLCFYV